MVLFSCGAAANESELTAFSHLKTRLQSAEGDDEWVLLSNLALSMTHHLQSDEIDLVAIGPSGVRVVEIKHWAAQWVDANQDAVEREADRVTSKAKKVATTLRKLVPALPRVDGVFLLTQDASKVKRLSGREIRGVRFHSLQEWSTAIGVGGQRLLSSSDVTRLARALEPKSAVALDGSLRRIAGYVNLELQTPKAARFHRVYKGSHSARRDRVVLHLYDLSASDDKNADAKARREFEVLRRVQIHSWAPRILDSFQEVPGYAGEVYFFTVVDPAAPSIAERATDSTWDAVSRTAFARNAVRALAELHQSGTTDEPILHRNLTLRTILVRYDNTPILTGFDRSRIPQEVSVASTSIPADQDDFSLAPEVRAHGWAVADHRADVYSLCFCLRHIFLGSSEGLTQRVLDVLASGLSGNPAQRRDIDELDVALSELLGESSPRPSAPSARFWTEDQVIQFNGRDYRIVARLGSGGVGTTFKVVERDRHTLEDLGTFVAKVAHEKETGSRVLKSYSLVRSHLRHSSLSTIFEVARHWRENEILALMTWISGAPLGEFTGVISLLAEEQQERSSEALALRWLGLMCEALDVLHRNGLVHGDVSPRNMIASGSDLVLTDYDFVKRVGEPILAPGTVLYCSASFEDESAASPSDDVFALAASFFHVVFDREPFRFGQVLDKRHGLNWTGVDRESYPTLAAFLDKATSRDAGARFSSARQALEELARTGNRGTSGAPKVDSRLVEVDGQPDKGDTSDPQPVLREQRVEWLRNLLQSYPGSRSGNRETRGLDTSFASETYVETPLEEALSREIVQRRIRLVVLCGNAGDGKTALLQHLAARLGLGSHQSSERVLEGRIDNGALVRFNLDGSASWRGRSADEILDEFLEPFQLGAPVQDIVHLLAINDGRLLEWIERRRDTQLSAELEELVQQQATRQESHIRFISLNQRSLVGGVSADRVKIKTDFLERLLTHLYGGIDASRIWAPCLSCSAMDRCEIYRASRVFGPDTLPAIAESDVRGRARARLFEALQAVHLRGETHITVRELRAALVFILFGTHYCDDYHADSNVEELAYWDRAFMASSPARQGEVLAELARFDPALEAHPQIDRYLRGNPSVDSVRVVPHYPQLSLDSARRRAYFEWRRSDLEQVAGDSDALGLARGRHLSLFRDLPLQGGLQDRAALCQRLCAGISRLEDLPPQALQRPGVVPLRVTPRTPTETAFWVEKPLASFRLEAELPPDAQGLEQLHRQASLIYRYRSGSEERLRLGAELFHLLLELADGFQLGDVSTDDTFAHLSIFVQRLVREDEQELLAWNPMQDEAIYKVAASMFQAPDGLKQVMAIAEIPQGIGS